MPNVRVLVVDDSAAMRALFCDILDNAKGVDVCGVANNADQARDKIAELNPDVLTLDVEMPGMSGMEFLEEVMADRPMPVIMLSSITQAGTGTAQRALELGAVHCFPKPLHSSQDEFNATVAKLGGIVIAAANGELDGGGKDAAAGVSGEYEPDGKVVVLGASASGIDGLKEILASYPANCPPTLVVFDGEVSAIESAIGTIRGSVACAIEDAIDGMTLKPGTAYLAYNATRHVIVEPGEKPVLRLVDRDPVNGFRPSADLLFGSLARSGIPAVSGLLTGNGADGAKGAQLLASSGAQVFVQKPPSYASQDRFKAVEATGASVEVLEQDAIANWILAKTAADVVAEAA